MKDPQAVVSEAQRMRSEDAKRTATLLGRCRFDPGSWDKKFCRDVAARVAQGHDLTEKQMLWIDKLAHKYRNQLEKL